MKIGYRLSVDDYVAFNVYHVRSSPSWRRSRILWGVALPLGLFAALAVTVYGEGGWFSVVWAAIPPGLLMLWMNGGEEGRLRRSARKIYREGENRGVGGLESVEATEAGLIAIDEFSESRVDWRLVERIVDTPDYFFIYTGAVKAVVIPKLKVTEGDLGAFVREVEERVRAVQPEAGGGIVSVDKPVVAGALGAKSVLSGVVSVGCGVAAGAAYGAMLGLALAAGIRGDVREAGDGPPTEGAIILLAIIVNLAGLIVGIAGLAKRSQKKGPAIIGVVINGLLVMGVAGLVALALVVRAFGVV